MINLLLDYGILQFGRFEEEGLFRPYTLHLEMLPSYPDLLDKLAEKVVQMAKTEGFIDRVLCDAESIPLGVAVSLKSGIPLVYSRGSGDSASYDLVGAYDVGHPAVLITNTLNKEVDQLVKNARSVGLEVHRIVAIFETIVHSRTNVQSLYRMVDVVKELNETGYLADEQVNNVTRYIEQE